MTLQGVSPVIDMELQKLLEERRAMFVPNKLQDAGNAYENQLSEAVLNNKIKEVEELLMKHLDKIDMNKGVKGLPPLLTAAMMNRVEICRLLLETGRVDVNDESSRWRTTPLRLAVKAGHVRVIKLLFDFGASVEASESKIQANPLLHTAIQSDSCYRLQVVKVLLEKGCNPNGRRLGNSDTPVHICAKHGHLDIFKMLIENGAVLDGKNKYGVTPFYDAILRNNLDIAQWLMDNGCNIHSLDMYGVSPVRVAAIERNVDAIKLLVKAGVSLSKEGPDESSYDGLIDLVTDDDCLECLEVLMVEGARQKVFLHSPDIVQQTIVREQSPEVVAYLLNAHPQHDINPQYTRAFFIGHGHLLLLGYLSGMTCLPSSCSKVKGTAECKEHLKEISSEPWKLRDLCRVSIRRQLGFTCLHAVNELPLPNALKQFLLMEDMKWCLPCADCEENEFVMDCHS